MPTSSRPWRSALGSFGRCAQQYRDTLLSRSLFFSIPTAGNRVFLRQRRRERRLQQRRHQRRPRRRRRRLRPRPLLPRHLPQRRRRGRLPYEDEVGGTIIGDSFHAVQAAAVLLSSTTVAQLAIIPTLVIEREQSLTSSPPIFVVTGKT